MESIKDFLIEEEYVLIGSGLFSKTLIDHDFYLLPKQPFLTMIWKGRFSNEQINISLDSYNLWKCSIRNFTGKVVMKRIYSIKDLRCFLKDNEMLYYEI